MGEEELLLTGVGEAVWLALHLGSQKTLHHLKSKITFQLSVNMTRIPFKGKKERDNCSRSSNS